MTRAKYPRISRLIEIQATRIIAGSNPESCKVDACRIEATLRHYVQRLFALGCVQVVIDRQMTLSQERIATGAALLIHRVGVAPALERVNRDYDERCRCNQCYTQR